MSGMFESFFQESHHQFRETCRRFTEKEIRPRAWQWEEEERFDTDLYGKAGAAGLLAPSWPESWGGGGGDLFHDIVAHEELLRGGATGAVISLWSLGIALPPVVTLGTPEQQQRFIPPVLAGEKIAALAITEPDTGSDVAGIRTRARREGDGWVLDGAKTFITSGVNGHQYTVLARTSDDPHNGLTFFIVERDMPGFRVARALKKTGWRSSDTAELAFQSVRVPDSHRLGEEGSGFVALMKNFEKERLALAILGYVLAEMALEEAVRWAGERRAFNRHLKEFQVIRHKLADMRTRTLAAKNLTLVCARHMAEGKEMRFEAAMAKNFASDVARDVCYEAVQIFGGMGYMRETLVERWSRDARLLPIGGGTREIMNDIIAAGMGL